MKRRALLPLLSASLWGASALLSPAPAQTPDLTGQTIRIVVGFPAGGTGDAVARMFAQELQKRVGATFVVDNRAGAGGQIAAEYFRTLPADNRTLLMGNSHMFATLPLTSKSVKYDPVKDFAPVARLATFEHGMAVSAALPAQSVADYLKLAQGKSDLQNYGIPAAGSAPHFIGYVVGKQAKVDLQPIPYKGGAPLLTDLMGNSISAGVDALGGFIEPHRTGRIRVLAVTGAKRSPQLPNVPTFAELGYPPALSASGWVGFFAPVGTSAAFTQLISTHVAAVAAMPAVRTSLGNIGFDAAPGNPQQLAEAVKNELALWAPVIKESGFQPQ